MCKKDIYANEDDPGCEYYIPRPLRASFSPIGFPYVLIYKTKNEELATELLETEEETLEAIKGLKAIGCQIFTAIEFASGRKIKY